MTAPGRTAPGRLAPGRTAPGRLARRIRRPLLVVAVALVPLAFAGLYAASLVDADAGLDRIPAAIVNEDQLVTTTDANGDEQHVLAGRQLVTELTGADSPGLDWRLTNRSDADAMLAAGEVYAVLTIPADFSRSILSLQGDDPRRADLAIRTDDAHSYLAGAVAQSLGDGMARAFGAQLTEQYLAGVYGSLGELGSALADAADGASALADGADAAAGGAADLADGVAGYTSGVSGLSDGLGRLRDGSASLDRLSSGVAAYTGGVDSLATALADASAALAADPADPVAQATVQGISAQLSALAGEGAGLAASTRAALDGIQDGIARSADGAAALAANGPALTAGARGLASGAGELSAGAGELATGLRSGADQVPAADADASADAAAVVADPVGVEVSSDNGIERPVQVVATFLVPIGLWAGALAVFLVVRPATRRMLGSSAASGRLLAATLARAFAVTAAQAALLVLLLHTALGVDWALLPATAAFSLLVAGAFTAFHHLLTVRAGRAGLVVSLLLLALQVAALGGVYPVEVLAAPFRWVSPFLPVTWATSGMQQLVAGGDAAVTVGAVFALLAFGAASVALTGAVLRRARRTRALALLPASA